MSAQNIDVLAVMDDAATYVNSESIPLREARAAVSELIEALRETTAAIGYLNRAYPPGDLAGAWQRNDAFDRAKAALARIGGAA